MGKSGLKLIQELSAALDRENIRYCHWKSNEALYRSLSGDNDLDLLIDPAHRFQFSRLLVRLGFKQAASLQDAGYPGMFHFYSSFFGIFPKMTGQPSAERTVGARKALLAG